MSVVLTNRSARALPSSALLAGAALALAAAGAFAVQLAVQGGGLPVRHIGLAGAFVGLKPPGFTLNRVWLDVTSIAFRLLVADCIFAAHTVWGRLEHGLAAGLTWPMTTLFGTLMPPGMVPTHGRHGCHRGAYRRPHCRRSCRQVGRHP